MEKYDNAIMLASNNKLLYSPELWRTRDNKDIPYRVSKVCAGYDSGAFARDRDGQQRTGDETRTVVIGQRDDYFQQRCGGGHAVSHCDLHTVLGCRGAIVHVMDGISVDIFICKCIICQTCKTRY